MGVLRQLIADVLNASLDTTEATADDALVSHLENVLTAPACRVEHTAPFAQTITTATDTAITFDFELWDTGTIWAVGNPTRLTAAHAGFWWIYGTVDWAPSSAGARNLFIRYSNTSLDIARAFEASPTAGAGCVQHVGALYQLAVGEYVELMVRHTAGVNLNINAVSGRSPAFGMARVA
jgi:hypothetical protein